MYLACFIHLPQTPSKPPDVKSWTTFFTNKFEKAQKISPTRLSIGFVNQFEPCGAYLLYIVFVLYCLQRRVIHYSLELLYAHISMQPHHPV